MIPAVLATVVAACTLLICLAAVAELGIGNLRIARLEKIAPLAEGAPSVSIVIAARDEQRHIEAALTSMLRQDYPDYEVIAVDDRSTDRTGAILDRMAQEQARLRVVHVDALPAGWLGKNHALHTGAARASGSFLLFTDADIVMDPTALARAMRYAEEHALDHLAVAPRIEPHGFLFNTFLVLFGLLFNLHTRPRKVRDPKNSHHVGIGAFNLVRTSAYRSLGGHERIAMRPDDDMKLGKLIKSAGFRQDLVFGGKLVEVDWYDSLPAMIRGLMKNMFASLEYNVAKAVTAAAVLLIGGVWPVLALALTGGWTRVLNVAVIVLILAVFAAAAGEMSISPLCGLAYPVATMLIVFVVLRSMAVTLRNGGIEWRGTRYSLAELRANKI